jgi:hypothetical protein
MLLSAPLRGAASSFSRRLRARLLEHRIKGVPELVDQMRPGAIPKSGDFDSAIRSLSGTTCDNMVEDPSSAFNFAGKIHLPTTVSGESSVSENLAPDAPEN